MKACLDCKHCSTFRGGITPHKFAMCFATNEGTNVMTGQTEHQTCLHARRFSTAAFCGLEAKHFEPRTEPTFTERIRALFGKDSR